MFKAAEFGKNNELSALENHSALVQKLHSQGLALKVFNSNTTME
jgi:hypothetical protein